MSRRQEAGATCPLVSGCPSPRAARASSAGLLTCSPGRLRPAWGSGCAGTVLGQCWDSAGGPGDLCLFANLTSLTSQIILFSEAGSACESSPKFLRADTGDWGWGKAAWVEPWHRQTHWPRGEGSLGQPPPGARGTWHPGPADRSPTPCARGHGLPGSGGGGPRGPQCAVKGWAMGASLSRMLEPRSQDPVPQW